MPILIFTCVALIMCFAIIESILHSQSLSAWLALPYFFVLGFGVNATAFGIVNMCLAHWACTKEAQGWFGVFAMISVVAAVVVIVVTGGMTMALKNHLYMVKVCGGVTVLFFLMCGMFVVGAASRSLNWW